MGRSVSDVEDIEKQLETEAAIANAKRSAHLAATFFVELRRNGVRTYPAAAEITAKWVELWGRSNEIKMSLTQESEDDAE